MIRVVIVEEVPGVPKDEQYYLAFDVGPSNKPRCIGHGLSSFPTVDAAKDYLSRCGYTGPIEVSPFTP
jgi:hypothetical protein